MGETTSVSTLKVAADFRYGALPPSELSNRLRAD